MTPGGHCLLAEALRLEDLDDAYEEYLWGESSPRAFARKSRVGGAKRSSRNVDLSRIVTR